MDVRYIKSKIKQVDWFSYGAGLCLGFAADSTAELIRGGCQEITETRRAINLSIYTTGAILCMYGNYRAQKKVNIELTKQSEKPAHDSVNMNEEPIEPCGNIPQVNVI